VHAVNTANAAGKSCSHSFIEKSVHVRNVGMAECFVRVHGIGGFLQKRFNASIPVDSAKRYLSSCSAGETTDVSCRTAEQIFCREDKPIFPVASTFCRK
jgi:hypothetical protein